jgi:hypothetical protein
MGVKCRADVVFLQVPPGDRGYIGNSYWPYGIGQRKRVWMAIWRGSSLVVVEWTALSRDANEDVIATIVRRRGEKHTMIGTV